LRHQQLSDRWWHGRSVGFGVAVGTCDRLRLALREVLATQSTAGGVQRSAAQVNAFVGTDGYSQFLNEPVAAVGVGRIEPATPLDAVEQLGLDARPNPQLERASGQTLGGQGHGPMGNPEAIQEHPGHGFARGDRGVGRREATRVAQLNQRSGLENRRHTTDVLHAVDVSRFQAAALPCSPPRSRGLPWRLTGFYA
jgi:hypothetical protein